MGGLLATICVWTMMVNHSGTTDDRLADLADRLHERGIEARHDAVEAYLRSLEPSAEQSRLINQWIRSLGSPDYAEREQATRLLISSPSMAESLLSDALEGGDDEVRWRAEMILEARSNGVQEQTLMVVLEYIAAGGTGAMTDAIMIAVRSVEHGAVQDLAERALVRTLDSASSVELLSWLESPHESVRHVALLALIDLESPETESIMMRMEQDDAPVIRLSVAENWAKQSNRRCLPIFVELIAEEQGHVQDRAARHLRALTGERFAFSRFDPPDKQAESIANWREWVEANGETVTLLPYDHRVLHGRVLITLYSQGKVLEFDEGDNLVWEIDLANAFACEGLENGHRLIAQYSSRRIVEYDAEGNLVWEVNELPGNISGVSRLENGNTLVAAGQSGNLVIELDPSGEQVWQVTIPGSPVHAARLDNGRTLLSLMNSSQVVEVDSEGTPLWELTVDGQPYFAQRLDNGNTMVRFSQGGAAEYTRDGEKVWSVECSAGYSVQRLADGTTLLSSQDGYFFYSSSGEIIRENKNYTGYLYSHQY